MKKSLKVSLKYSHIFYIKVSHQPTSSQSFINKADAPVYEIEGNIDKETFSSTKAPRISQDEIEKK